MTLTTTASPGISNSIFLFPFKKPTVSEFEIAPGFQFPQVGFLAAPRTNYYRRQARLSFNVLPEFAASYVMIRGLIEFNRSRHLQFHFDVANRNFTIELDAVRLPELATLLQNVNDQLKEELRFKAALKKAIEFERRYRQACAEVYQYSAAV